MTLFHVLFILLTLLASSILVVLIYKKRENKPLALLVGFGINLLTLSSVTLGIINFHIETRLFGLGHTGSYILILFMPIISLINFYTLEYFKRENHSTHNKVDRFYD